jgi:hypothetical protein
MSLPEPKWSLRKSDMTLAEKVRLAVLIAAATLQVVYIAAVVQQQIVGNGLHNPTLRPHLTDGQLRGVGWAVIACVAVGILLCARRRLVLSIIAASCAASGLLFSNVLWYPEKHAWLPLFGLALFFVVLPVVIDGVNDFARLIVNRRDNRKSKKTP